MLVRVAHTAAAHAVIVRFGRCSAGGVGGGVGGTCHGAEGVEHVRSNKHALSVNGVWHRICTTVRMQRPARADLVLHACLYQCQHN